MSKNTNVLPILAIGPIWIFFVIFLLQLCSYAVVQKPTDFLTIIAFLSVGFLPGIFFKDRSFKSAFLSSLSSWLLIAVCYLISAYIYDTSYDGQTYHQLAVSYLERGWNFFQKDMGEGQFKLVYVLTMRHYPKFPWLVEASLYGLTNHIEGAKSLNLVLLLCSAFFAYLAAKSFNFSRLNSILLASALALNPVAVCQLWTFYVDGLLASTTLIFFSAAALFYSSKKLLWAHIAGIALIILIHIKFTALVVAASFSIVLMIAVLRKFAPSLQLTKILISYFILGLLVVGWHPYVQNFLITGNPIYPIAGYSPVGKTPAPKDWPIFSVVHGQQPEALKDLPGPLKTLLSVNSRTADPIGPNNKFEFFWNSKFSDYSRFVTPDIRLGAFGPFYSIALLISLLSLIALKKDGQRTKLLSACAIIVLSSLLNPESWWGRYSPQLWLLPLLISAACKHEYVLRGISLALVLSSIAILATNTNASNSNSLEVKNTLKLLTPYTNSSLPGSSESFFANELRLSALNIKLVSPDTCLNKTYFAGSPSFVCLP